MANTKQRSIVKPDDSLLKLLLACLIKEGGVKIIGFGIFKLKRMKAVKNGFNPFTKKRQSYPAYTKITFTPSKQLKQLIQRWKK